MVKMSQVLERSGRKLKSGPAPDTPPARAQEPSEGAPESSAAPPPSAPQKQAPPPKAQQAQKPPAAPSSSGSKASASAGKSPERQPALEASQAADVSSAVWSEEDNERLVSLFAPSSAQAKRIDILRSQLLYPFHGEPPRTIMVTSALPQEGKSLLAANLAVSFARGLQQYVMIMDCHLMEPTLHSMLKIPRRPGLTDYLEHGATVPEIMHWTRVDKLSCIPAGSPSHRSSEILATDRMVAMIKELRARYADRYIIFDTPPVQAFDDPSVLARMVEGIVFVVLSGATDRDTIARTLGRLPEEKLVGVVLNDKLSAVSDADQASQTGDQEG